MNYWWDTWDKMSVMLQSELMRSAVWQLFDENIIETAADTRKAVLTYDCVNFKAVRKLYQTLKSFPANIDIQRCSEKNGESSYRVMLNLVPSVVTNFMFECLRDISEKRPEIMDKVVMLSPAEMRRRKNTIYLDCKIDAPDFLDHYKIDIVPGPCTINGFPVPLSITFKPVLKDPSLEALTGVKELEMSSLGRLSLNTKIIKLQTYIEMARRVRDDAAEPAVCLVCYPPEDD